MRSFPLNIIAKNATISINKLDYFTSFHSVRNDSIKIFIIIFMLSSMLSFAQNAEPKLHGYIQSRFTNDFGNQNDFMIRRAKLWVDGNAPGLENVSYKIQTVYRSFKDETVMLQDAFADVKFNGFGFLRVGRFVPDFLLQRMQPDYAIPYLERADVINYLIHSPQSMARQIGIQFTYTPREFPIHLSAGVFNANLVSPSKNKNQNLLYTSHTQIDLKKSDDVLAKVGFSFAYRYVNSLSMNTIFNSDQLITGNDFRFGFEYQLNYKNFVLQTEYIQANIDNYKAWGYYIVTNYSFTKKIQAICGIEKFSDLITDTNNNQWYSVGLIYYLTSNTKLITDFKTQVSSTKNNYLSEIQYQIFFN